MNAGFTSMIIFMIVAAPANYVALADGNVASMIDTTYPWIPKGYLLHYCKFTYC